MGKTWAALLITLVAWLAGKRVLFVTTEMSQARVSKRFYSLHFKIPYKPFHEGDIATRCVAGDAGEDSQLQVTPAQVDRRCV